MRTGCDAGIVRLLLGVEVFRNGMERGNLRLDFGARFYDGKSPLGGSRSSISPPQCGQQVRRSIQVQRRFIQNLP